MWHPYFTTFYKDVHFSQLHNPDPDRILHRLPHFHRTQLARFDSRSVRCRIFGGVHPFSDPIVVAQAYEGARSLLFGCRSGCWSRFFYSFYF